MKEFFIYYSVRVFGVFVRLLPLNLVLMLGKLIGTLAYYLDVKRKTLAYANLKMAFADTKSPDELKQITKRLFKNFGQNLIELFRMPLINSSQKFNELVKVDGKDYVFEALKRKKGVILLAMHFGSWELASLSCAMLDRPYKVFVKQQKKYSRLDDLLNSYRACGGNVVLSRGLGTRDFIKSLKNNEIIGMVVDQGGRDGVLVPFFGREASMSVGAIRMGLKFGVPLCFSVIIRESDKHHRVIVHEAMDLINTGDMDKDIVSNLKKVTLLMEKYITQYPEEYMWFYKIWKYSKETKISILSDGKTGHLRQSQYVAQMIQEALKERDIKADVEISEIKFKSKMSARLFSVLSFLSNPFIHQGRLSFLKRFLTKESFDAIMSIKADFVVSCGSSIAGVNYLLSKDHNAKSVAVLKPGILGYKRFSLVVMPEHDMDGAKPNDENIAVTQVAPNLINSTYLKDQAEALVKRKPDLATSKHPKIGLFIGGDSKNLVLQDDQITALIQQLKEVADEMDTKILMTTSRRTSKEIEAICETQLGNDSRCLLSIIANQENIEEAVGGMMGLCDILVVSGDSISMISEAVSSEKKTVVFYPQRKNSDSTKKDKHIDFINHLNDNKYIVAVQADGVKEPIKDLLNNKIQTKKLTDNKTVLEAVKKII